jgi:broad specificity phosphatase PhoE
MKKPRLIICRHAESIEDVDNSIYDILDDLQIPLTEKGTEQAYDFGAVLAELLRDCGKVVLCTSPGVRNVQTMKIVTPMLPDNVDVQVEVEPLIVKQDWGTITAENRLGIESDRYKTGESAASMINRLKDFSEKVFRIQHDMGHDVVVFSHGFEFRVLLMIILGWDEEFFESFGNLHNCEYRILIREENGTYTLNKPLKKHGLPITRLKKEG